jgi:hypothetical protein
MYMLKATTEKNGSLVIPYAVRIVVTTNSDASHSELIDLTPSIQLPVYDSSWKEFSDASESEENIIFLAHLIDLVQFANAGIESINNAIINDPQ